MATLEPSTGPDQNPKQERNVAGILYLAIILAVVCAVAVYFVASSYRQLNPYEADRPGSTAPDVSTETSGDRSGAVAEPQSENVPVPDSQAQPESE